MTQKSLDTLDFVYLVKTKTENAELKYSLRSLSNIPHGKVWIVGFKPNWVSDQVGHVPTIQQISSKYLNGWKGTMSLCENREMSDDVVLMNDDFFVVRQTNDLPVYHRGMVADYVESWKRKGEARYPRGGLATAELLSRWGVGELFDYEMHVPFRVNRAEYHDLLLRARSECEVLPLHRRTLYGNFYRIGGEFKPDCKVFEVGDRLDRESVFCSTTDVAFNNGIVGAEIMEMFPEKSEYER